MHEEISQYTRLKILNKIDWFLKYNEKNRSIIAINNIKKNNFYFYFNSLINSKMTYSLFIINYVLTFFKIYLMKNNI